MTITYFGGVSKAESAASAAFDGKSWEWITQATHSFLGQHGSGCFMASWESLTILIRGYARPVNVSGPLDLERVAGGLRYHYLEHGELDVDALEGSFTVVLMDGQADRVLLYRNLVGTGFTYYRVTSEGFFFGSNLVDLVDALTDAPAVNRDALPAFFLYRCVPGSETLFDGFSRLLPGEQIEWSPRGLKQRQRHSFGTMRTTPVNEKEALESLEDTMGRVIADCADHRRGTANLLSGGVDSSYLQAIWNRVVARRDELPPSFSVSVDHPRSWADTDYAMTASRALGTRHRLVAADGAYADYLVDTLATTGEPPNHVQSSYFGLLARIMSTNGMTAGLCGEGADSLFGLGLADQFHAAAALRRWLPLSVMRSSLGAVARLLRWHSLQSACQLANRYNDYEDPQHPVNRVAAFADWDFVTECFGLSAVKEATAGRRELVNRFSVSADPLEQLHAAGFLGEAMDSASLWTTLFESQGMDLLCPFLDSRIVGLALNLPGSLRYRYRRPKDLLKRALLRHLPADLVYREKLGFGQPIFEWLAPGGQLRSLAEGIEQPELVEPAMLDRALQRPGWFLYSLLVYDVWHKLFIARSLPRNRSRTTERLSHKSLSEKAVRPAL